MLERIEGSTGGQENLFGLTPSYDDINWNGSDFTAEQFAQITSVDKNAWIDELKLHSELFDKLAYHLPTDLTDAKAALEAKLTNG
jgi:phosphoenolpyruvate carboxykinase (GTP)